MIHVTITKGERDLYLRTCDDGPPGPISEYHYRWLLKHLNVHPHDVPAMRVLQRVLEMKLRVKDDALTLDASGFATQFWKTQIELRDFLRENVRYSVGSDSGPSGKPRCT